MLVVNTYKLLMRGTEFVIDGKQPYQKKQVITEDYYDEMMLSPKTDKKGNLILDEDEYEILVPELWRKTGFYIEILKEETDKWEVKFKEKQEHKKRMREIEAAKSSDILSRAISNSLTKEQDTNKKEAITIPNGIPNEEWDDSQIKQWLKDNNIPFGGRSGKEALLKKVQENI